MSAKGWASQPPNPHPHFFPAKCIIKNRFDTFVNLPGADSSKTEKLKRKSDAAKEKRLARYPPWCLGSPCAAGGLAYKTLTLRLPDTQTFVTVAKTTRVPLLKQVVWPVQTKMDLLCVWLGKRLLELLSALKTFISIGKKKLKKIILSEQRLWSRTRQSNLAVTNNENDLI